MMNVIIWPVLWVTHITCVTQLLVVYVIHDVVFCSNKTLHHVCLLNLILLLIGL